MACTPVNKRVPKHDENFIYYDEKTRLSIKWLPKHLLSSPQTAVITSDLGEHVLSTPRSVSNDEQLTRSSESPELRTAYVDYMDLAVRCSKKAVKLNHSLLNYVFMGDQMRLRMKSMTRQVTLMFQRSDKQDIL